MSYPVHSINSPDGFQGQDSDRVTLGVKVAVANAAGAAGATVATAIAMPTGTQLPANYTVIVNPSQGCGWYVSAKTTNGFTVNLVPFSGTATVAAGSFDCVVVG